MFKLFRVINDKQIEIAPVEEVYTVLESGYYKFEYNSPRFIDKQFFIEDEPIGEDKILTSTLTNTITKGTAFFEDYFGFAKISINKESFQVNILIEKLKVSEVEDIMLYLYENNHFVLDKFVSKSTYFGKSSYGGKNYIFSSKYLNMVDSFCTIFEQLFISFKNIPKTIIRKKFDLSNYNSQVVDFKSIEWILQNLDSIFFDTSLANHPDSIKIFQTYGLIDKVGSESNSLSFKSYENEIILGAFKYLQASLAHIKHIVNQKLIAVTRKDEEIEQSLYSDFRDFKKIPFVRLLNSIKEIENRVSNLFLKYSGLFRDAIPQNFYPKLTPVFVKYKHYQKAFETIRLMRNSQYNLDADIQLLNIRKLSQLYELYNLSVMVEEINRIFRSNELFNLPEIVYNSENDLFISKIVYTKKTKNYSYSLWYEPQIKKEVSETDLVTIGNHGLSVNGTYCRPDYVIEVNQDGKKKYCILDAKYSKIKTIENIHKFACVKKYLLDVGVIGNSYQKADFLILLHPDSTDNEVNTTYNTNHFPQIKTIISKPKYKDKLQFIIRDFV